MFADPQSITVSGSAKTLNRTGTGPDTGAFASATRDRRLTITHNYGRRIRRTMRFQTDSLVANPLVSGQNINQSITILVISCPCALILATPTATLARARRQALKAGLRHVYTGNVFDPDGQATRCAGCGALAIARHGYRLLAYHLDDTGRCRACGRALAGRFAGPPGTWGSRRLRVAIES